MADRPATLRDRIEAAGAILLFGFLRLLPLGVASGFGGFIARSLGPRLAITRRADRNLQHAFPEMTPEQRKPILRGVWDNLGRTLAEYPHLDALTGGTQSHRVEVVGAEHFAAAQARGQRIIFFSGHFGNWEVTRALPLRAGLPISVIYRAPNNPIIDRMTRRLRESETIELVPKGKVAARRAIEALGKGRAVGILIDQKLNDGIAVPFLGRDAMTAPALARLALRYDCTVLPVRVDRLEGARFRLTCEPPLDYRNTGDLQGDIFALTRQCNAVLERWIRERPGQWFWLHRRWPD